MNGSPQTSVAGAPARPGRPRLRPSFVAAWRGVWLFTWKSNTTWVRMAVTVLTLVILPLLVYLTTSSPEGWSRRYTLLGSPAVKVHELTSRLSRAGARLRPQQRSEVARIFEEEFARAEAAFRSASPGETSINRQKEQIRACYDRIHDRSQTILDERQFSEYRTFENRSLALSEGAVRERRWSRTEPFYHWLIDLYFFVILPLNCVRTCGGLIRDEVQADTLSFLTTRPLTRARLVVVKYLSQVTWLQILMLVEALLLIFVGTLRQLPGLGQLLPLFIVSQILAVFAWSALGAFLGQATKRYMAAALIYGLVVEMGIGRIPTNINNLSIMRHLKSMLAHDAALQSIYDWSLNRIPYCVGAIVLGGCIFLGLAVLLFTYREYHHTVEMQK